MGRDQTQQMLSGFHVRCFFDLSGEIEIIPTDDAVFDQAVTGLCDLLFFLFGLGEPTLISDGDCMGEAAVGQRP